DEAEVHGPGHGLAGTHLLEVDRRLIAGQREGSVGRNRVGEGGGGGDQERDGGEGGGASDQSQVHRSCLGRPHAYGWTEPGRIVPGLSSPVDGLIGWNGARLRPPSVPVRRHPEAGPSAGFGVAWGCPGGASGYFVAWITCR